MLKINRMFLSLQRSNYSQVAVKCVGYFPASMVTASPEWPRQREHMETHTLPLQSRGHFRVDNQLNMVFNFSEPLSFIYRIGESPPLTQGGG